MPQRRNAQSLLAVGDRYWSTARVSQLPQDQSRHVKYGYAGFFQDALFLRCLGFVQAQLGFLQLSPK